MTELAKAAEDASGAPQDRGSIAVWAGFVWAPVLWITHLQLEYMLIPWVCTNGHGWVTHATTLAFLAASAWCIYLCWREWRHVGGGSPSSSEDPPIGRTRFAGMVGILSASLFTLIIAAQHIPAFFFSPCWD